MVYILTIPNNTTPHRKEQKKMKNYKITVDGYTVGVIELTPAEVQNLEQDPDITVERV
jgi:hypothetical protein